MRVAWISDDEIIPFENIEAVAFDLVNTTPVADVMLSNTKEVMRIAGKENVAKFKSEYTGWIDLVSKATLLIENIDQ